MVKDTTKYTFRQTVICILTVIAMVVVCSVFNDVLGYKIIALLLLMTVSFLAMLFDIIPVVLAAVLSALIWNYFFIPPLLTLHIGKAEDVLMFLMYFVIALVNAILTYKIRRAQNETKDKKEKEKTLNLYNTVFNSLSHELRTPLATIFAATDTLQYNGTTLSDKQKTSLLEQIGIASNRLNEQLENLLNMSRLETGMLQLNKSWCDINDLISEAIHKTENNTGHSIHFQPNESLPLVKIDLGIMQQIVQNIIGNAIKHTSRQTIITIQPTLHENDTLEIKISDNGRGVNKNEVDFLFDKFYRVSKTATGGTGLGLSIAKGYTEAHGGLISAEHNHPSGLIIRITLPVETSYINKLKNE